MVKMIEPTYSYISSGGVYFSLLQTGRGFNGGMVNSLLMKVLGYDLPSVKDVLHYRIRAQITDRDDQVTRFTRWNTFSCKEEALVYIKDFCIPHPYCRSICVNDRSIGFVFIRQESGDDKCRAELGYAIAAKYWGQGVTTRALKMAISDGLGSFPDLVRLQARVDVENKASQRVLEKLGFLKEGVLRKYTYNKGKVIDLVVYSLLSTDPMP
ncbi:uncharacterized protein LOC133705676 isoform X2 [Populus nigra]|uniref:uncharacterized protein LOC133705676 isoform X2 n=1 Tax=Populus nigra TaxID=3691 RepID=UPI002B27BF09|nr:uncharacterized protein LOC133705676 isoform X2 [Populus nigra]